MKAVIWLMTFLFPLTVPIHKVDDIGGSTSNTGGGFSADRDHLWFDSAWRKAGGTSGGGIVKQGSSTNNTSRSNNSSHGKDPMAALLDNGARNNNSPSNSSSKHLFINNLHSTLFVPEYAEVEKEVDGPYATTNLVASDPQQAFRKATNPSTTTSSSGGGGKSNSAVRWCLRDLPSPRQNFPDVCVFGQVILEMR